MEMSFSHHGEIQRVKELCAQTYPRIDSRQDSFSPSLASAWLPFSDRPTLHGKVVVGSSALKMFQNVLIVVEKARGGACPRALGSLREHSYWASMLTA